MFGLNEPTKVSNERHFQKQTQKCIVKYFLTSEIKSLKAYKRIRHVTHREDGKSEQHQSFQLTQYTKSNRAMPSKF